MHIYAVTKISALLKDVDRNALIFGGGVTTEIFFFNASYVNI